MSLSLAATESGRVVVDHICPHGPRATHIRGMLFVNSVRNLQTLGVFERYTQTIEPAHRDVICQAIAASWVPIEHAVAHYDACDRLNLSSTQLQELGVLMAGRISETFMGSLIKRSRGAGFEGLGWALSQLHRLHARVYQGGHVLVIETGPKDALCEVRGLPHTLGATFRSGYISYCKSLAELLSKRVFVRYVKPLDGEPQTLSVSFSWV